MRNLSFATLLAVAITLLMLTCPIHAWSNVALLGKRHIINSPTSRGTFPTLFQTLTTTKNTSLFVFGWFTGSDSKDDDLRSDETVTASLAGISGIMDSMSSFKTSQRVSDRTSSVLQELANTMVEGSAADGKVKVTYNGQQLPISATIDETYFRSLGRKTGAAELSTALTEAMQEAHKKSASKMEDKLKALYSDLGFDTQ